MQKVLVTGSSGLIGSEAVTFFDDLGLEIIGIDNNMRADFFGPKGDTSWNCDRLKATCRSFRHADLDIRDRDSVLTVMENEKPDLIVHAAAQPSHDLAADRPFDDFDTNATGTLNLLEATRRHAEHAVFIHVSTNKVYGDAPNHVPMAEHVTRYDYADPRLAFGIAEDFPIDQSLHSLFGASKLAADVMAQEYGRYFGLNVGVFRGGCLTGPSHSGVELHGFLNYLVRTAIEGGDYTIFGYQGKQVRDQIHSRDVINAFWHFAQNPRPGEVYNLGGGKQNAASLIECVELIAQITGCRPNLSYTEEARRGDHVCYYSDLRKLQTHFPGWSLTRSLPQIIEEIAASCRQKVAG
ncbi:MAG: NAD-dependent epimerase/dehydratase family protein [Planctomycetota bacterium]